MAEYGENNPHMTHVDDVEAIAKRYLALADDDIEKASSDESTGEEASWEVCADTCQMFDNVKHMAWFCEAVALLLFENSN
ncbi:MAG TPA: hypothetical protein VFR24_00105 [Candidatus Angelobacter sp.]|nr:hypothetical protein [Candidatus Angelobacter sp.]